METLSYDNLLHYNKIHYTASDIREGTYAIWYAHGSDGTTGWSNWLCPVSGHLDFILKFAF